MRGHDIIDTVSGPIRLTLSLIPWSLTMRVPYSASCSSPVGTTVSVSSGVSGVSVVGTVSVSSVGTSGVVVSSIEWKKWSLGKRLVGSSYRGYNGYRLRKIYPLYPHYQDYSKKSFADWNALLKLISISPVHSMSSGTAIAIRIENIMNIGKNIHTRIVFARVKFFIGVVLVI